MSKKKEKKSVERKPSYLSFYLFMFVFIVIELYFINNIGESFSAAFQISVRSIAYWYIAILTQTIIHEAGHLVFGLLTGYKFKSFNIYSLMIVKQNGKLKFKREKLAKAAGQCLMDPPDLVDGKMPYVLLNLGGSILNLITSVFFGVLAYKYDVTFFWTMTIIGSYFAFSNGIPMRLNMFYNDGHNALEISRNPEAMKACWLQLKIAAESQDGVSLVDMNDEWFTLPSDEAMKSYMVSYRGAVLSERLMIEKRFEEAIALIRHLLTADIELWGVHRFFLKCDLMYLELIGENRKWVIAEQLTKEQKSFMRKMRSDITVIRTEYTIALLFDNDLKKAASYEKSFERAAKYAPYSYEIKNERELMALALETYKRKYSVVKTNEA